jgi:phytoene synthase
MHKLQHTEQNSDELLISLLHRYFFAPRIKEDLSRLLTFIKTSYQFSATTPHESTEMAAFKKGYTQARENREKGLAHWESGNIVTDDFVLLAETYAFDPQWTELFLATIQQDCNTPTYFSPDELLHYLHGSTDIVAFYIAQILHLPKDMHETMASFAKAVAYTGIIRDIPQHITRERQYLPVTEVDKYRLPMLTESTARHAKPKFEALIRAQIETIQKWRAESIKTLRLLPKQYRIAIRTAFDCNRWLTAKMYKTPLAIFDRKLDLPKWYVIFRSIINFIIA